MRGAQHAWSAFTIQPERRGRGSGPLSGVPEWRVRPAYAVDASAHIRRFTPGGLDRPAVGGPGPDRSIRGCRCTLEQTAHARGRSDNSVTYDVNQSGTPYSAQCRPVVRGYGDAPRARGRGFRGVENRRRHHAGGKMVQESFAASAVPYA